ncbi:hypothetical protein MCEZEM1_02065 [Comamonadaceae bacterium]
MVDKLFPKLSQYEAVEESWRNAKRSDPNRKTSESFGGLQRTEGDPPDLEILTFIDAAFFEAVIRGLSDIYPANIASGLGRTEITFNEYLKQLTELGLDVEDIAEKAGGRRSDFLEARQQAKRKARVLFERIRSEWIVTDDEVRECVDSRSIYELLELVLAHADETRARLNAMRRHETTNIAKEFVVTEWKKYRNDYEGNKSAFARDYSARLRNEFLNGKGEPLDIKEKTIREVWLADTPLASKPAG